MADSANDPQAVDLFLELQALRRQIESIACDCSVYEIKLNRFARKYAATGTSLADQFRQLQRSGLQVREMSSNFKNIAETIGAFSVTAAVNKS